MRLTDCIHKTFNFKKVTFDADSETWNFKTSTVLKSMELKFKLNEEFDEKTPDGKVLILS